VHLTEVVRLVDLFSDPELPACLRVEPNRYWQVVLLQHVLQFLRTMICGTATKRSLRATGMVACKPVQ